MKCSHYKNVRVHQFIKLNDKTRNDQLEKDAHMYRTHEDVSHNLVVAVIII